MHGVGPHHLLASPPSLTPLLPDHSHPAAAMMIVRRADGFEPDCRLEPVLSSPHALLRERVLLPAGTLAFYGGIPGPPASILYW